MIILAVNLADSLALADRLVRIKHGSVQEVYDKEDFLKLPVHTTPWLHLYQEKYASEIQTNKKEKKNETWSAGSWRHKDGMCNRR